MERAGPKPRNSRQAPQRALGHQPNAAATPASARSRSSSGLAPLTPHGPQHGAAVADDHRAVGGDRRELDELADRAEEGAALVLDGRQLVAVAVPDGGPDGLRLRDLRAQRRSPVHAGERLQQAALVDDGDGDVEAEASIACSWAAAMSV